MRVHPPWSARDAQRRTVVCELRFPVPILAVRMNRKRVVLVFNKEINVYDLANMKLLDTIATAANPQG